VLRCHRNLALLLALQGNRINCCAASSHLYLFLVGQRSNVAPAEDVELVRSPHLEAAQFAAAATTATPPDKMIAMEPVATHLVRSSASSARMQALIYFLNSRQ